MKTLHFLSLVLCFSLPLFSNAQFEMKVGTKDKGSHWTKQVIEGNAEISTFEKEFATQSFNNVLQMQKINYSKVINSKLLNKKEDIINVKFQYSQPLTTDIDENLFFSLLDVYNTNSGRGSRYKWTKISLFKLSS